MTGSKLAGEAAKAALAALTMKDPGVYLAAGTAMILEDPVDIVKPSESENPDRCVLCFSWSYFVSSTEYLVVSCICMITR